MVREHRAALARVLPFAVFIGLMVVEPFAAGLFGDRLDERWLYGIRSGVAAILLAFFWRHYDELRPESGSSLSNWLTGIAVGLAVFILWVTLDFSPLVMGEAGEGYDPRVAGTVLTAFAFVRLAGSSIVVPVMEELFWRSFIMRWLEDSPFENVDPRNVGATAVLLSSAVFALEHRLWFAGLLAGLAYAILYRWTGDLRVAIVSHASTNLALGIWILWSGEWGFW